MGKLGNKIKRGVRLGLKGGVVAGTLLGAGLGVKQEYDGQKGDIRRDNRATLLSSFNENPQIKPLKPGQVVGEAGAGVVLGRSAPRPQVLPPPAPPIAPFEAKAKKAGKVAGVKAVAGVVGGQIGVGQAVKDVAGAVFDAGVVAPDPQQFALSKAGRDAQAGATVVAGAEGLKASNKELLGQLGNKVKGKIKMPKFGG
tara:strand:- start:1250 stop:1843 length:594 start_codon:yes stop_codon:yes gene_type:complete